MFDFDALIEEVKNTADFLQPFNQPFNNQDTENSLSLFKSRFFLLDGYDIGIYFNRVNYGSYYLETLQVFGNTCAFLPFNLLIKVATKFLGKHELCLIEYIRNNRKIYCWSIALDKEGKPVQQNTPLKSESCVFENFQYQYLYPSKS